MTYLRLFVVALLLAGCSTSHPPARLSGTVLSPPVQAPDFTLSDQRGEPWTLSQHRAMPVALMFGYTHCRDTCPLVLAKLSTAARRVGNGKVALVFVTVDPERDTPEVLAAYLKHYWGGRDLTGLTGGRSRIDAVMRSYHVWVKKIPGRHGDDDYDDDHSDAIYFIDRDGKERAVSDSAAALESFVGNFKALE